MGLTSILPCSLSVPFCSQETVPLRWHRALSASANERAASCSSRGFLSSHASTLVVTGVWLCRTALLTHARARTGATASCA